MTCRLASAADVRKPLEGALVKIVMRGAVRRPWQFRSSVDGAAMPVDLALTSGAMTSTAGSHMAAAEETRLPWESEIPERSS